MITITKSIDEHGKIKFDQSSDEILKQLEVNQDPFTPEYLEDICRWIIIPELTKKFGYELGNDNVYRKINNETYP